MRGIRKFAAPFAVTRTRRGSVAVAVSVGLVASALGIVTAASPAGAAPPIPSGPGNVWVVNATPAGSGSAGGTCASPSKNTIQAAVNAAAAGDTVYVCPGTYNESITISTSNLTLDGAQYGVAGFTAPNTPRVASESIVAGAGGIAYAGGPLTGETVNGFTINGYTGSGPGAITANPGLAGVGSHWTFTNNIIDTSNGGIGLNTDGVVNPAASTISGNEFTQSVPSTDSGGWAGQAVTFWGGSANNVSINHNDFAYLTGPGGNINTTGPGSVGACASDPSTGLSITNNSSENGSAFFDDNFAVLFCTSGAHVTGNSVNITLANDDNAVSAIYLGGGNTSTVIDGNTLHGNGAPSASGIAVNTDFYPTAAGISVTNNSISGYLYGIRVRSGAFGPPGGDAPSNFTISGNSVTSSPADGIRIDQATNGSVSNNHTQGSTNHDCVDLSNTIGSGTAGTNDTWSNNYGVTSSPSGLCFTAPARPAIGTVVPGNQSATVPFSAGAGGLSPTGFTATCQSNNGGAAGSTTGTTSPLVVSGLTGGKNYVCTVYAFNNNSVSAVSAKSNTIVPTGTGAPNPPGAPKHVKASKIKPGQLKVTFNGPSSNGGAKVTKYTAVCTSSNGGVKKTASKANPPGRPIAVIGLTVGKTYTCTVKATNSAGTGPNSLPSNAVKA